MNAQAKRNCLAPNCQNDARRAGYCGFHQAPGLERREEEVGEIARTILGLDTLETRKSDGLDFSDQAVWTLKAALLAAYEAGMKAGGAK